MKVTSKFRAVVLSVAVIMFLMAGCSKNNTNPVSAFVGNYNMNDTFNYQGISSHASYLMTVSSLAGTSDQVVFYNIGDRSHQDTGLVSGSVVTFTKGYYGTQGGYQYNTSAATASLSGNRITLAGGEDYNTNGGTVYATGVGIKQQ